MVTNPDSGANKKKTELKMRLFCVLLSFAEGVGTLKLKISDGSGIKKYFHLKEKTNEN